MPSSPELAAPAPAAPGARDVGAALRTWNRRLHYFLGLYFIFFVWLFALTGLLLNHGQWKVAEFWPNRKTSTEERAIRPPAASDQLAAAHDLMRQLGIVGEIQWLATRPAPSRLEFRAGRPGLTFEIQADLQTARAKIQRTELNASGVMNSLHTFTGVRVGDAKNQRDWLLTTIWALAMDAVAVGLAVMVLSGLVLWLALPGKRLGGALALVGGVLVCGWFLLGVRLFSP